jgi:hypothetical protein
MCSSASCGSSRSPDILNPSMSSLAARSRPGWRAGAVVRCAGTGRPRPPAGGYLACGHRRESPSATTGGGGATPATPWRSHIPAKPFGVRPSTSPSMRPSTSPPTSPLASPAVSPTETMPTSPAPSADQSIRRSITCRSRSSTASGPVTAARLPGTPPSPLMIPNRSPAASPQTLIRTPRAGASVSLNRDRRPLRRNNRVTTSSAA